MTLHQLFDLSTMEHRHLLLSYGVVIAAQAGYFGYLLLNEARLRRAQKR